MKSLASQFILWYLRTAARMQLKKDHPTIIGIAGSSGKSSLKRLLTTVLSTHLRVKAGDGKNSETGIPLDILGVPMENYRFLDWLKALFLVKWHLLTKWETYDIYLAEMGIDSPVEPKNMSYLLKIISPTIGMVTNVALEHSVYFDPYIVAASEEDKQKKILEMIAKQETLLLESLPKSGTAVVNIDDELIATTMGKIQAKQITISTKQIIADIYAKGIKTSLAEFSMDVVWKEKIYHCTIPQLLPEYYAYEFLFVLATAMSLEIPLSQAIEDLQNNFSLPAGRLSIFKGIKNTTIIDSSYNNATLEPIMGILDLLKKTVKLNRKLAIIGDMRELGSQSKGNHEQLAKKLIESVDEVILIGPLLHNYAAPILLQKKMKFQSFMTFSEAKKAIRDAVREKDIILVKSSQNTLFLERVVEMLLLNKEDVAKLCRREEFWEKQRAKTP